MTTYEALATIVSSVGVIVTGGAVWVAWYQLRKLIESNENANLMSIIALETLVSEAQNKFAQVDHEKLKLGDKITAEQEEAYDTMRAVAEEQLLNSLERLCGCIVRGQIEENWYKEDYEDSINDVFFGLPDYFGEDSRYHHIKRVHEKWQQNLRAYDPKYRNGKYGNTLRNS